MRRRPSTMLTRAVARWRVCLLASAEMFGFRRGTEFGVSHYLFSRTGC